MNKHITLGLQIVLGLIYFVFGLNGFFHFIPVPPMPEPAMNFIMALFGTPYFIYILKPAEILCGLMLLVGRSVPFALVVLAPITLNIFLFHLFLAPEGMALPIVMLAAHVLLMYAYWNRFKSLF